MWLFKWIVIAVCAFLGVDKAFAVPLDSWPTWSTAQPYVSKQVPPGAMIVRGSGTNAYYVLEANPTTGALPVDASIIIPPGSEIEVTNFPAVVDVNYGTPGASTIRNASMLGVGSTAVSNSNPVPISDAGGVITVDGTVAATQSGTWTVQPGNTANTTAWLVTEQGHGYADSARNDYESVPVTTGAWVQLIASTAAAINVITLFDSCGQTLELGTGGAGLESRKLLIPPGGLSGAIPLRIPASTRVAVRAISDDCEIGELDLTGLN